MFDGDIKPVREEGGVRSNTSVPVRSGWSAGMGPILHASLLHDQAIMISEYVSVGLESGGSSRCPSVGTPTTSACGKPERHTD